MMQNLRIDELKRRVQMDPASIAFVALAEEYRRAGQFEAAIDTCAAGLRRHPSYASARITLGLSLAALNRVSEARAELECVVAVAPESLAAIRALAEIHSLGDVQRPPAPACPQERAPNRREVAAPLSDAAGPSSRNDVAVPQCEHPFTTAPHDAGTGLASPALGGLEGFLASIARARSERVSVR